MTRSASALTRRFDAVRVSAMAKRALTIGVAVICVWAIAGALQGQSLAGILNAFRLMPPAALGLAVTLVATNYFVMWSMEMLALRDAGVVMSVRRAGISAFVGNALSVAAGLGPISGAGVRAGLFMRWGVPASAAAAVAMSVTMMSLMGGATLAALGLLFQPDAVAHMFHAPASLIRGLGVVFLAGAGVLLVTIGRARLAATLFGARLITPSIKGAALRIGLGALDWWISANVFHAFVSSKLEWAPLSFATTFATAHFAGMAAGAPAGIGVFDAIFLHLDAGDAEPAHLAASLLLYRLVGYAAPALLALGPYLLLSQRARAHQDKPE